jgi:hypothetical protein
MLALALAGSSCTCRPRIVVHREPLVTLPEQTRKKSVFVSDDGTDAVFVLDEPAGQRVIHAGREDLPFREVMPPRMAPQTKHVFYWAIDEAPLNSKMIFLVADGVPILSDIARTGPLIFSKNGGRWAAVGGEERLTSFDEHRPGPVWLWVDFRPYGPYADMSLPTFSPDGRHVAYLIEDDGGQVVLVVDGMPQRTFEAPTVPASPPHKRETTGPNLTPQCGATYLSDGNLLILATDRDGWAVMRGDTRLASYRRTLWDNSRGTPVIDFGDDELNRAAGFLPSSVVTASAAPVAAWWERLAGADERWRVVRDGQPVDGTICARHSAPEGPVISPDGTHVAYACGTAPETQPGQTYVIHDGTRYGPYADVWGIALSPDGRRVAFGADSGAPDGPPWFYVVDGRRGRLQFDRVFPPRFSPDGRHVAWVAERRHRLVLFLDHQGYASSDDLVWAPTFALGKGLSWAVIRGRRISRVDVQY